MSSSSLKIEFTTKLNISFALAVCVSLLIQRDFTCSMRYFAFCPVGALEQYDGSRPNAKHFTRGGYYIFIPSYLVFGSTEVEDCSHHKVDEKACQHQARHHLLL